MSNERKQSWEMTYEEMYQDWAARHDFGSKGAMTPSEAREFHNKWKTLGLQAKRGIF